jgi:hypothetical protein
MLRLKSVVATALVVSFASIASISIAQTADDKEVYTAFAVNMGGTLQGTSGTFDINITRWSTAEERNMLLSTLKDKGHDEFMKALRKQKETGFVRGQGRMAAANPFPSTRLHAAWQSEKDGKREVVLVTERPIGMREAASASRSLDYDTSVIIMDFPADDKTAEGSGTLYMALKIQFDDEKNTLKVEEWGQQPTRLTKITRKK